MKRGIEEASVCAKVGDEFVQRHGIGDVAAPFAGDAQFATRRAHFFDQQRLRAERCGFACRE